MMEQHGQELNEDERRAAYRLADSVVGGLSALVLSMQEDGDDDPLEDLYEEDRNNRRVTEKHEREEFERSMIPYRRGPK